MSTLGDKVSINRRFARSARIDADLNGTPPLVGYVLQASVAKALSTLAASQIEHRQAAFTWTGPYGGGKSSAALLLANLIAGTGDNRAIARDLAGPELTKLYAEAFPEDAGSWGVVAVTGSRHRLRDALVEAAAKSLRWTAKTTAKAGASDSALIEGLLAEAKRRGGLLLILDELGKLLEHEALEGGDVHLLQDLAEHASRSEARLVVIGILHQSFDQYAARAARDARQEWAKVQGRFQDIAFLSGADETVALLGRAITATDTPAEASEQAAKVAKAVSKRRPTDVEGLGAALTGVWPLNPVTALLLGPVSRQRFAQNERSLFGFLSSAEPAGFQEFLAGPEDGRTYDPDRLWDYLAANFGMALAQGGDGNRLSLAFEAIERAAAKGGALHIALTKSAALIELFRNGSGLAVADDILAAALPAASDEAIAAAVRDLLDWAVLIRQPRLGGYALFAGSDFDLDEAIERARAPVDGAVLAGLPQRIGFGSAAAKRHYFTKGALRTFEILLQPVGEGDDVAALAARIAARTVKASGALVLVLGDGSLDRAALDRRCKAVAKALPEGFVAAIAAASDSYALRSGAAELVAVERVLRDHPQLEGDRIARREIAARQSGAIDQLHRELEQALRAARWWLAPDPSNPVEGTLSIVASALANEGYPKAPVLHSELLQRDRPSSNSMAALRELAYAMVRNPGVKDLGIEGWPAERGLYLTVLAPFGLHRADNGGAFDFREPDGSVAGKSLKPAWDVLTGAGDITLDELYATLAAPPYGIKRGLLPLLVLAYLMSARERVAVYVDGLFQTAFDDVFVDKLLQKDSKLRFRHIDRSMREAAFLSQLAALLEVAEDKAALPVAQALFRRFEDLPAYALKTQTVTGDAAAIRAIVTRADDPEAMLFDDLPDALGERLSAELIGEAIAACEDAYPSLLAQMTAALARALGVDQDRFEGLTARAAAVSGLTNDLRFDAFALRAAAFEDGAGDIEGLISLLVHKPARSWTDRDREQALSELARMGRRFRELEALAVVRNRRSDTEAVALVVGIDPNLPPVLQSFELTGAEQRKASALAERILQDLGTGGEASHLQLAALARAVAALAADAPAEAEAA